MQQLSRLLRLRSLWRSKAGNALVLTGLALPVVIGAAGVGIHTVQLTLTKRQLQREADSAAMAGGLSLFQDQGNTAATAAANKALTQNNLVANVTSTITPGSYTSGGTTYTESMYVKVTATVSTPLMNMFGLGTSTVAAEARAATVPEGEFCFLALEDQVATGITFKGNTKINLGCGAGTNAKGASAVVASGSSAVTASPVAAMGQVPPSNNYATGTVLMSNYSEISNPLGGTDYNPTTSEVSNSVCKNGSTWKDINVPSGTVTNSATLIATTGIGGPGKCYGTINVQGTLTLDSGTYFIANGANNAGLQIGAQGKLFCTGCTFVLTSTTPGNANSFATMSINGGATLDLKAPTTGKYDGIMIYRDSRAAASNQCCTINGNSNSSLKGAFYFPSDELTFNGTAGMTVECFQMVGKRLKFTGDSEIDNTCRDKPGDPSDWVLDKVRLIS